MVPDTALSVRGSVISSCEQGLHFCLQRGGHVVEELRTQGKFSLGQRQYFPME